MAGAGGIACSRISVAVLIAGTRGVCRRGCTRGGRDGPGHHQRQARGNVLGRRQPGRARQLRRLGSACIPRRTTLDQRLPGYSRAASAAPSKKTCLSRGTAFEDFGVHDLGDAQGGSRSPIEVVVEHGIARPEKDAAFWLCDRLGRRPKDLRAVTIEIARPGCPPLCQAFLRLLDRSVVECGAGGSLRATDGNAALTYLFQLIEWSSRTIAIAVGMSLFITALPTRAEEVAGPVRVLDSDTIEIGSVLGWDRKHLARACKLRVETLARSESVEGEAPNLVAHARGDLGRAGMFSPGIWWSGLSLNRSGSSVHRLQMNL